MNLVIIPAVEKTDFPALLKIVDRSISFDTSPGVKYVKQTQKNPMERRLGADRRCWTCQHDFPYVDSHGILVERERRELIDRRDTPHPIDKRSPEKITKK